MCILSLTAAIHGFAGAKSKMAPCRVNRIVVGLRTTLHFVHHWRQGNVNGGSTHKTHGRTTNTRVEKSGTVQKYGLDTIEHAVPLWDAK